MNIDDVPGIHALLYRMREEDPDFRVFGANGHEYLLGPVLSEDALLAFEQKHQVTLPADYRLFLKQVGNGGPPRDRSSGAGAGPDYGLLRLEEDARGSDLSKPFPLPFSTPGEWIRSDGTGQVGQDDEDDDEEPQPGLLPIVYSGCTFMSFLVVKGPAYGTVWDGEICGKDFCPTGLTFSQWYGRWLDFLRDRALPILAREQVTKQVREGMSRELLAAICGADGEGETRESTEKRYFLRFPHLATQFEMNKSDDTVARIVRFHISMHRTPGFDPD